MQNMVSRWNYAPLESELLDSSTPRPFCGPVYFISDLHLNPSMPETAAAFEHFMQHTTQDASAVFILGDLFEYWVGDGMVAQPFVQRILSCMRAQTTRTPESLNQTEEKQRSAPLSLYVMRGNRDFLLGPQFAALAGAQLLPDPYIFEAFGQRIALSHGDYLCTADRAYQRFRRFVHHPLIQRFFLAWPLSWRLKLAHWIRAKSEAARSKPAPSTSAATDSSVPTLDPRDVNPQAVAHLFAQTHTQVLIHGHTHRPAHHRHDDCHRWVLSDWDFEKSTQQKRGSYIRLDEKGIAAIEFDYSPL